MRQLLPYTEARDLLLRLAAPVGTETVPLEEALFRVLAEDVAAPADVPGFDRSAFDGYAVRAADLAGEGPRRLRVIGQLRAGDDPAKLPLGPGEAAEIMTGAPLPPGADAVVMFERAEATGDLVSVTGPLLPRQNVVRAGEALRRGELAAGKGTAIDVGLLGLLSALGRTQAAVVRRPVVGVISTGAELVEAGQPLGPGGIYDANRFLFLAALRRLGCEPRFLGTARDEAPGIAELIRAEAETCDALVLTGGVSVGRYDLTPAAMGLAGAELLFTGVDMKPGKSCAYGLLEGKLLCALSGNPAAALTNFAAVAAPALRRLCGLRDCLPRPLRLRLEEDFPKESRRTRLLRGAAVLTDGTVRLRLPPGQGNSVLSSAVGWDAVAVVPAGSGPLPAGTELDGFLIW